MAKTTTYAISGTADSAVVRAILTEAGFALVQSEPDDPLEVSMWTAEDATAVCARDFATGLLTVVIEGAGPDLEDRLPVMRAAEARSLVEAEESVDVLRGLRAAAILKAPELAGPVARLIADPDDTIAESALTAFTALAPNVAIDPALEPGVAFFSLPGWRWEKLQILRWMMHDRVPTGPGLAQLLAQGLQDRDWEIRVTAMLTAGRLGVPTLEGTIARLDLPGGPDQGISRHEHRVLLALRDAVLRGLGVTVDRQIPDGILRAVEGDLAGLSPGEAPFVTALATPLPDDPPEPRPVPGVELTDRGPVLADGGLLVWVPPVLHWLGDSSLHGPVPTPARLVTPSEGFYIDAEPRGRADFETARSAVAALAAETGARASLPSADQWEMAARGPDGRRFPWGMNAAAEARVDLSPWGMTGIVTGPGEWAVDAVAPGRGLVAGVPFCAQRTTANCDFAHTFRCVFW